MTYTDIAQVQAEWEACAECQLGVEHTGPRCIGQGATTPKLLVVTPSPIFTGELPAPYGSGTKEGELYKKITDKLGIDRQTAYMTPAVACKVGKLRASPDHVGTCRARITQLTELLNPQAVILLGPEAMFSWCGQDISKMDMGEQEQASGRYCVWTHDFARYLAQVSSQDERAQATADEMFQHWGLIANQLKT